MLHLPPTCTFASRISSLRILPICHSTFVAEITTTPAPVKAIQRSLLRREETLLHVIASLDKLNAFTTLRTSFPPLCLQQLKSLFQCLVIRTTLTFMSAALAKRASILPTNRTNDTLRLGGTRRNERVASSSGTVCSILGIPFHFLLFILFQNFLV